MRSSPAIFYQGTIMLASSYCTKTLSSLYTYFFLHHYRGFHLHFFIFQFIYILIQLVLALFVTKMTTQMITHMIEYHQCSVHFAVPKKSSIDLVDENENKKVQMKSNESIEMISLHKENNGLGVYLGGGAFFEQHIAGVIITFFITTIGALK